MAELKTKPTRKSVQKFLKNIEHKQRKFDALNLLPLMENITGKKPVLWGDSIIGFGQYTYTNTTGKPANWPITGFSPRKQNLTIYIMLGFKKYEGLLKRLGKYKTSVSCLYINKLEDVDVKVLEKLIKQSYEDMLKKYECK